MTTTEQYEKLVDIARELLKLHDARVNIMTPAALTELANQARAWLEQHDQT